VLAILFEMPLIVSLCCASGQLSSAKEPNQPDKPMIIWFHNAASTDADTLIKVVKSGIVSDVIIAYFNPYDDSFGKFKGVRDAVKICKDNNVSVIWCRGLWPSYDVNWFKEELLYDHNYYENMIDTIRKEAVALGAEKTAIDTEAYVYFPFKKQLMGKPLEKDMFDKMLNAVNEAVKVKGQLDFVLPTFSSQQYSCYNTLVNLGKYKIAEHTYYNVPSPPRDKKIPYDIFGAYVSVTPQNEKYPDAPYFTIRQILERQDLWSDKKGLMLFPRETQIAEVVEDLASIKTINTQQK
jgi:hypothetical protein